MSVAIESQAAAKSLIDSAEVYALSTMRFVADMLKVMVSGGMVADVAGYRADMTSKPSRVPSG